MVNRAGMDFKITLLTSYLDNGQNESRTEDERKSESTDEEGVCSSRSERTSET